MTPGSMTMETWAWPWASPSSRVAATHQSLEDARALAMSYPQPRQHKLLRRVTRPSGAPPAGALIEVAPTGGTPKRPIAQRCHFGLARGRGRRTVRAGHRGNCLN